MIKEGGCRRLEDLGRPEDSHLFQQFPHLLPLLPRPLWQAGPDRDASPPSLWRGWDDGGKVFV